MKNKLFSYTAFVGFLSLIILLTSTTYVQALTTEKWTGSVSFNVKAATRVKDTSGNHKLVTSTETFEGTMNFYNEPTVGPIQGPDGCILELLSTDGSTKVCFTDGAATSSENKKSGKGSAILVGTGTIEVTINSQQVTGIAYINGKGSLVVDTSGNLISLSLGGSFGGGYTADDNPSVIFTGTIPTTVLNK
jgi:hypothetical protein